MKMAFAIAKKKKDPKKKAEATDQQEMQQKMMQYGLPLMIGVFAFQFPAAVSLYWAVSTLFAIGQQYVVNKRN
jgi:YidC/Oxa1 family membrane protein insertase